MLPVIYLIFFPPSLLSLPLPYVSNGYDLFAELQGALSFFGQPQVDGGLLKLRHSCFLRAGTWALDCVIRRR